ncbi:hypothetical protein BDR22DRAFT_969118 [Usnea florida]
MDPLSGIAFALGAGSFLFDVFDKSVQAYRLYSTAQSLANVSGHLVAKLMIEERRLIQWGDGVGIKSVAQAAQRHAGELDDRLKKNEALYQTVRQVLIGIEETLTDVDNLKTKYGLQVFEEKHVSDETSLENESDGQGPSKALKTKHGQSRRIQASTSIRKKFYLYGLLPKENINAIDRDVLANLIDAATSERLLQYATVASPSVRSIQDNFAARQYATIASAAMTSLQIADVKHLPPFDVWIDRGSIGYDGKGSRLGTFSRKGFAPARVFIETAMFHRKYSIREDIRKATTKRIKELALLLKEPRHFGFATMACLGVISNLNEAYRGHREFKLVYELPLTADPLASPVSLYDLLSLDEYRSEEPPEVDVRFQLVNSLAKALHEMYCIGWLHRNISSNNIFFLKIKNGSGIESLDLEKLYVAGFHAARSFVSGYSGAPPWEEFEGLVYIYLGYLLYRSWSESKVEHLDTLDKLFYIPRSEGLECTLGEKLKSLNDHVGSARWTAVEPHRETDQETEQEHSRRRHMLETYVAEGAELVEEEGITDFPLDEEHFHDLGRSNPWEFWEKVYGLHKLREDAIRACQEKLGSRMVPGPRRILIGYTPTIGEWFKNLTSAVHDDHRHGWLSLEITRMLCTHDSPQ